MTNFILIFVCLLAGMIGKSIKKFPNSSHHALNSFIIYLSFPSLIFSQTPKLLMNMDYSGKWWLPMSMAWLSFILSYFTIHFLGKKMNWSSRTIGALILTVGLGNTSFVGFPLLEALIGPQAISIGILVDQPGSFLVLSTLGIIIAASSSGESTSFKYIIKRIFSFPPFIALFLSFCWFVFRGQNHAADLMILTPFFEKIAVTLVPLALFAVGFQLNVKKDILKKRWKILTVGIFLKLIIFPAFFLFFYTKILNGADIVTHVIVLESAMATMITSAVVANEFNLDSELANLMVGATIPLSLLSVPLWNYVFNSII